MYVAMCLFDVVVALDIKKIEKNGYFCIFLSFPLFSAIFPNTAKKLYSGPSPLFSPLRYM